MRTRETWSAHELREARAALVAHAQSRLSTVDDAEDDAHDVFERLLQEPPSQDVRRQAIRAYDNDSPWKVRAHRRHLVEKHRDVIAARFHGDPASAIGLAGTDRQRQRVERLELAELLRSTVDAARAHLATRTCDAYGHGLLLDDDDVRTLRAWRRGRREPKRGRPPKAGHIGGVRSLAEYFDSATAEIVRDVIQLQTDAEPTARDLGCLAILGGLWPPGGRRSVAQLLRAAEKHVSRDYLTGRHALEKSKFFAAFRDWYLTNKK